MGQKAFWIQWIKAEDELEKLKLIQDLPMFYLNNLAYFTPSLLNAYLKDLLNHIKENPECLNIQKQI